MRRLISIVIAVPASLFGHLLLWTGGVSLLRASRMFGPSAPLDLLAFLVATLGLALIAASTLTVALSSAGVILLGAIQIVLGALAVVLPFQPLQGVTSPVLEIALRLRELHGELGDGLLFSWSSGAGMLAGVVLLVLGLAVRGRRGREAGGAARGLSVLVAIPAGLAGTALGLAGGSAVYRGQLVVMQGVVELPGLLLLLAGAALLALAVATAHWSSVGLLFTGIVVSVLGLVALVTTVLSRVLLGWQELASGVDLVGGTGNLALLGVLLLAGGVGAVWRARRSAVPAHPAPA